MIEIFMKYHVWPQENGTKFVFKSVSNMGLEARKPVFGGLVTTHAQTRLHIPSVWWKRSLISAFVIPYYESIICKLVTGKISIF